MHDVPAVTPTEAQSLVAQGAVLVDIREPHEWDEARIPGAVHIPMGELEARLAELPGDRTLVLQCRSGNRSGFATARLLARGRKDVVNLAGGILAWARAGLPVER